MRRCFEFIKKHKIYFLFLLSIGFLFSFLNLISYTYSLYITETKETYDVRELQKGDTIPFGVYLTGEFYKNYFINHGYGLGSNSVDSFNILYCEDAECSDGYVLADSFVNQYKVKDYSAVFGMVDESITGWSVNLVTTKSESYSDYAYSSILEKDLVLYPSKSEKCCCDEGIEKIYDFVKISPTSMSSNWNDDEVLSFVSTSFNYNQEVSLTYHFTASKPGLLRFMLLTNMMDVVVSVNDVKIMSTDFDFIFENSDTYYSVLYNVENAGDYEVKIYLSNYIRAVYMNYIYVKDVMFLTETNDEGFEEKNVVVLTTCSDGKTCFLGGSITKEDDNPIEVPKEEINPDTIDSIFLYLFFTIVFGIGILFLLKKLKIRRF